MGRWVVTEGDNLPEAVELDVASPVVQVEGVKIFGKDRAKLAVVNNVDRFVVEIDFQGTKAETNEPHSDGEPPGEPRMIALLAFEPRFVSVSQLLG